MISIIGGVENVLSRNQRGMDLSQNRQLILIRICLHLVQMGRLIIAGSNGVALLYKELNIKAVVAKYPLSLPFFSTPN